LAREDESLDLLTPSDIVRMTSQPNKGVATDKNENLKQIIITHQQAGDLVLCLTAGGGGSLDEWLRKEFKQDESA
jgi:N-methylhydantoinase B/oxoprolinase/acetone carboxylase alpha subunit